ncbi:M24 family metallopeptidase [Tuberibacillus sp. Marseille-P3662]|uniref:M24 family metallopeptidase n=1 Tax=Tuberibacillus sp. Marseille-P3662 TaxID=1965358 RepID=UPI000A1C8FA7|nr:aminopeptidase P family protein [Tuberibacillus sp. Marseille-P3662]
MTSETDFKIGRLRSWLETSDYDALTLTSQASFSWLTGGRGHIGIASDQACAKFIITLDNTTLVTNNIESQRLIEEEIPWPCDIQTYNWFDPQGEQQLFDAFQFKNPVLESSVLSDIARLRQPLTAEEQERYKALGKDVGTIIERVCEDVKRGDAEFEVAAKLASLCIQSSIEPVTNLIAADERVFYYRHPLPTRQMIQKYALIVIGGRRHGLIASASRLVHFGKVPDNIKQKHRAVTNVDATFITGSRPGVKVADLFHEAAYAYNYFGFKDEWRWHHQGGLTGYVPREYRAHGQSTEVIGAHQAFAWNPSITGVKSEDTILVGTENNDFLTRTNQFPEIKIEMNGDRVYRPDILERHSC